MNISLSWFINFGLHKDHDARTRQIILSDDFINHAKKGADEGTLKYIDSCVRAQTNFLRLT